MFSNKNEKFDRAILDFKVILKKKIKENIRSSLCQNIPRKLARVEFK